MQREPGPNLVLGTDENTVSYWLSAYEILTRAGIVIHDGTVTSVALSSSDLNISGSPITTAGTINLSIKSVCDPSWLTCLSWSKITDAPPFITKTDISGTAPIVYSNTTGVISITQSNTVTDGYLTHTDWNTFNNKQDLLTKGNLTEVTSSVLTITGGTNAVIGTGTTIQIKQANTSQPGYLSNTDWNTFNNKQNSLTTGNFTEATSSILTITGGTGAIIGSGLSVQVKQSNTSQSGYLSNTDWNTFNGKQASGNYITALTGDVTASGPGSVASTLATVNSNVGTFGSETLIPIVTVNGKGLITAISTITVGLTGYVPYVGATTNVNIGANSFYTTGKIGIGTTTPITALEVVETSTSTPRGISNSQYNTGNNSAQLNLLKARGTLSSPLTIVTGDVLGRVIASGHDGTGFLPMADIKFISAGTIGTNRIPTVITFSTATDAATSVLTERMRIDQAGNVGIGTTTMTSFFNVSGQIGFPTGLGVITQLLGPSDQSFIIKGGLDATANSSGKDLNLYTQYGTLGGAGSAPAGNINIITGGTGTASFAGGNITLTANTGTNLSSPGGTIFFTSNGKGTINGVASTGMSFLCNTGHFNIATGTAGNVVGNVVITMASLLAGSGTGTASSAGNFVFNGGTAAGFTGTGTSHTGGVGSNFNATTGAGGAGSNATSGGPNVGGKGGSFVFIASAGGASVSTAVGGSTAQSGDGGDFILRTGAAGVASGSGTNTTGNIGQFVVQIGGANTKFLVNSAGNVVVNGSNALLVGTPTDNGIDKVQVVGSISSTKLNLNGSTSGIIGIAPAASTTSYNVILPNAQGTGALTNDGSGNLSWTSVSTYTFTTGLTNTSGTVTANISTGISGGQTIYGGTGTAEGLTIYGSSGATGYISMVDTVYIDQTLVVGNNSSDGNNFQVVGTSSFYNTLKLTGATSGVLGINFPSVITSYNIVMPAAQGGANTYLKNNGSGNLSWSTVSTGTVTSVSGTTNRITVATGTTTPVIDISASYVGQSSITTLGTIGTGIWQGTKVNLTYGGTNADLSATGGTSQVLQQSSVGGAITVGQLSASDLSNGITGSGSVVLAASPTLTGNPLAPTQGHGNNSTRIATTAYVDRHPPLVVQVEPSSSLDINADITDVATVNGQNVNVTVTPPSGTLSPCQGLVIRIKDDGNPRTITWDPIYRATIGNPLPTITTTSQTLYVELMYNATDTKWDAIIIANGF